jgi:hypothetical protein
VRIRQVKPEFWADADLARLSYAARLIYVGLWCVADDAGWIDWRPERIAHDLLGYEPTKARERHLAEWSEMLVASGHLQVFGCGCALIPSLSRHQRVTGKTNTRYRDAHGKHLPLTGKQSIAPGMGMGMEVEVEVERNDVAREAIAESLAPAKMGPSPTTTIVVSIPRCEIHDVPMKPSKTGGGFYCPRKLSDGTYCKSTDRNEGAIDAARAAEIGTSMAKQRENARLLRENADRDSAKVEALKAATRAQLGYTAPQAPVQ